MRRKYIKALLVWLVLSAAVMLIGGEKLLPEKLAEFSKQATVKKYPDSDTVLLYNVENIRYDEKGLSVSTDEYYQKVLTEKGLKQLRSFTFHFNTTYETLTVEKVKIIRNGQILSIDPLKNSKVSIEPGQMGSNIYDPANKILTLTVPGLEVNDIVGLKVRSVVKKARIPGFWGNYIPLQSNVPILKYEVNVDGPKTLPLRSIALKDKDGKKVRFSREEKKDRIIYRWVAENVPQVIPEPDMPPLYTAVQRLLIGTAENWTEISRWYYNLCRPHLDKTDEAIRAKVRELTANSRSRDEKIMSLFQFVSQKIRYMGLTPESEAPGYEPHDVTMTFHRRYGVCRDKAALLVAMLEAAGLKAYPVLIMAGIPKDDDVPNGYFNHAITAVETAPGRYILMDPTNESARELLPATLANCSYLVAKPEGDKLRRTDSPDARKNSLLIQSTSELDGNGRLTGEIALHFTGVNDMLYRDALSRWTPEEAEQYFSRQLNSAIPGAELAGLEITPQPVRDMSKPLQIKLRYQAEDMLPSRNGPAVLQLPELGDSIGASGFLMGSFDLNKRRFKLQIPSTFSVYEDYTLKLPSHLRLLTLPEPEDLAAPGLFRWSRQIKQEKNVIHGKRVFSVDSLEFTPEGYQKTRDILKKMDMKKRALPIVENDFTSVPAAEMGKVFAGADSLVLSDRCYWRLLDSTHWQEEHRRRIRILTYAGMKDNSEVRVAYDPSREQVSISGKVISPDGRERHLQKLEKNIMDASWNASAPRYPGGKILVANFPGVEIGSEIEVVIKRDVRKPYFSRILTFAGYSPIVEQSRIIDIPERMNLRYSPLPAGVEMKETRKGVRRLYSWTARNIRRIPAERNQAAFWHFTPSVFVSAGDWKNIAGQMDLLFKRLSSPELNPQTKHLAVRLTEKLSVKGNEKERLLRRVKVLRDFAARNIRSAGPGLEETAFENLSPADVTLKSGYGNSADRAILLGALLRAIGVEVEFVPVSDILNTPGSIRLLSRFPQKVFQNVLVYVIRAGIYLNDTGQYAEPGTLNSSNRLSFSLRNGRVESVRPGLKHESRIEKFVKVDIRDNGSATITVKEKTYGPFFENANRRFAELTPELRHRYFTGLAADISRAAELKGIPVTDFRSYPGEVSYSLNCPGFVSASGEYKEFDLPFYKQFIAMAGAVEKNRKTPFIRKNAMEMNIRYEITFPARYSVSSGRPAHLRLGDHSIGTFNQDCFAREGKLDVTCKIKIPAGVIPAADCDRLFTLRHHLARPNAGKIVLIPKEKR